MPHPQKLTRTLTQTLTLALIPTLRLALILALAAVPARAEAPNLSANPQAGQGTATRLVLAQRLWGQALASRDVLMMLTAIRIARSVTLRPAQGWEHRPADPDPAAPAGREAAPDPASDAALAIVQTLAGTDPDLQDLAFDLDAQLPRGRTGTALTAAAELAPGQADGWRLPLFGEVAAELALIGDGDGPLSLTLTDAGGNTLCATPPSRDPALCRLTPARNGFFTLSVRNHGQTVNSYRLIGN